MSKMLKITTSSTDTGGMATITYGDALATGEDTLTSVNVSVDTKEKGNGAIVSKGKITAVAEAEASDGGVAYADATTDLAVSGVDRVSIKTKNTSGDDDNSSYDISVMKFKAIDWLNDSDETIIKQMIHDKYDGGDHSIDLYLQGNVAISTFDALATGSDTLVTVDAYALAIEDELSLSTVMTISAVD
jgi:hypothetical protein